MRGNWIASLAFLSDLIHFDDIRLDYKDHLAHVYFGGGCLRFAGYEHSLFVVYCR